VRLYYCCAADAASGKPWSRASPSVSFPYPSLPLIPVTSVLCVSWDSERGGVFCPVRRRDFDAIPLGYTSGCLFCLVAEPGVRVAVGTAGRARHFLAALQLCESGPSARVAVGVGRARQITGKTRAERSIPPRITWTWMESWMCAARCQRRNMANTPRLHVGAPVGSGESSCQSITALVSSGEVRRYPVHVSSYQLAHRCAIWNFGCCKMQCQTLGDGHRSLLDVDRMVPWIGRRLLVLCCRLSICSG
jgi:hypothetical protein